jgi:hypothetical protein
MIPDQSGSKSKPRAGRPRGTCVDVWVSADEKADISARAAGAGMSESAFLRALGLNQPIRSVVDLEAVDDLAKINGGLGRVAGLLKLWLAEKRGIGAPAVDVDVMMREFRRLQRETLEIMGRVLSDR